MYRGGYKSTCTTIGYPLWRALYMRNFACKIIENSRDNAMINHILPIIDLFTSSQRSDYLRWLYQHRIPAGMRGTNADQISFIQENPLKAPSITYMGVDSRFEGWHGDLVVLDDPEGAEADASTIPNVSSYRAFQKSIPLLEEIQFGQILVVGTSHGDDPLIWRLREQVEQGKRKMKIFWRPLLKPTGVPYEPHRYPPHIVEQLKQEDIYPQQYALEKRGTRARIFSEKAARKYAWSYTDPMRTHISYPTFEWDPEKLAVDPWSDPISKTHVVEVKALRKYLQVDPTHRLKKQIKSLRERPSNAAAAVIGVASDSHSFILEKISEDISVDRLAQETIRLARKWNVVEVIYESVGAQVWFKTVVEAIERAERLFMMRQMQEGKIQRSPHYLRPSFAERFVEAEKANMSKEELWREHLAPLWNWGFFHLHETEDEEVIHQAVNVSDPQQAVDLIDAIAQGVFRWRAPADGRFRASTPSIRARESIEADPHTGYAPRYRNPYTQ